MPIVCSKTVFVLMYFWEYIQHITIAFHRDNNDSCNCPTNVTWF